MIFSATKIFDRAISLIFGVLLLFITVGIIAGVVHLFLQLGNLVISTDITLHYVRIVSDVLTLFVLIELSRSLVSHFSEHRLRLTFIADAGIVFVLREIMFKLFEQKILPDEVYALSALLFVLGSLRTASVLVYQREKRLLSKKRMQGLRQPPLDSIDKTEVSRSG
ncbi:MAG: phosphate-starvation-inducible PsiE family protein [Nitrosomonadales bacterium]|nr:phosphate-starvation-inducible PsiE family protein [Nitrosomonadales bacterium]